MSSKEEFSGADRLSVEEITIKEIVQGQRDGAFSAEELVYEYFERIARFDKSGPGLNAVLELNPDAPAIAAACDAVLSARGAIGPLHGVPVLLKDNINTADRMHTSGGSLALENSYAPTDAFLVQKLREAGAVILGKANMTEWANFMAKDMPNGYSSRGGQVINPYGRKLDPGGSSTGSAVATAANLCAAAVGTETSGSILSPAARNMLVGIKPTVGLVSRSGIIPISHSQDTAGPLARTVADAAILLSVMRGVDEADPATRTAAMQLDSDYASSLHRGIEGLRIGVPRKAYWKRLAEGEISLAEHAIERLRALGAKVIDPADIATAEEEWSVQVLLHEFKSGINAYFASLGPGAPVKTLNDVVAFNRDHSRRALKYGQSVLRDSERFTSGTLTEPDYINARLRDLRISRTDGIDKVLSDHKLDALFFPAFYGCAIAAQAGYPSVTVPAGTAETDQGERPFGVTVTGPAFSEPVLLQCAAALERSLAARRPPDL